MKEYGGYIELDKYSLPMLHEKAVLLNSGRNALVYLFESKKISKIALPYFLCDSVPNVCKREGVSYSFYHINKDFIPENINLQDDEWLYLVNYYGQLSEEYILSVKKKYDRVIVDNAQSYFSVPLKNIDTLYTCRKFFGVADGAVLYTDKKIDRELDVDESFERMHFLLGRFERTASEFYSEYADNNHMFADEPLKQMSKLTANLLHAVDYDAIKKRRNDNFKIYDDELSDINGLKLHLPDGAFAYPFLVENGFELRKYLQSLKIYIPLLWPFVRTAAGEESTEAKMASDILPLPCDQRYSDEDIKYIIHIIKEKIL